MRTGAADRQRLRFVEAVRRWAALLRTGSGEGQAWRLVADREDVCVRPEPGCCLGHSLRGLAAAVELGADPRRVPGPSGVVEWQTLLALLQVCRASGAAPAETAERFADASAAELDAERARRAAAAGPKSTVTLLRWMPLGGLGIAWLLGAGPDSLLGDRLGWLVLTAGVLFAAVGHVWAQSLLRTAAGPGREVDAAAWLDVTAALLRSGASLVGALERAAVALPGGQRLRPVLARLRWGADWDEAWGDLADEELAELGRRLQPLHTSGMAGAAGLTQAARAVRQERRRTAELAAEQLAVRLVVPLGLCHLPAFVCLGVLPLLLMMLRGPG
ncbi:type II secretion system F family protein [Micrococcus lylae]|uniref:type II secretion system F family protein n=1 Tax=Micrococcus lylae TaxID=1273 RepID=UPI0021557CEC|nr:type II secretion system F family protein [Micrococcus lylae]WIK81316.1 type II secretion system F family protein [Micrococcus lylae]